MARVSILISLILACNLFIASPQVQVVSTIPVSTTKASPDPTTSSDVTTTTADPTTTTAYPTTTATAVTTNTVPIVSTIPVSSSSSSSDTTSAFIKYTLCTSTDVFRQCSKALQPVCAFVKNCRLGTCTKTAINSCTACIDPLVQAYTPGACEAIKSTCDTKKRPEICFGLFSPVCAIASNCKGPECYETKSNVCFGCRTDGVDYTIPGDCPPKAQDIVTLCDSTNRPQYCIKTYKPVCGSKPNCIGTACITTFSNSCAACADPNIESYVQGAC